MVKMWSFFSRVGGKNYGYRTVLNLFPDHHTYVEPFCGGASVFLRKTRSPVEVLNDIDTDVIDMFKDIQLITREQLEAMDFKKGGLSKFNELKNNTFDSVPQRFYRNLYINKHSFAGNMNTFTSNKKPTNYPRLIKNLDKYKQRLSGVLLFNEDYETIIRRFDSPTTFFYIDPPYEGSNETHYQHRVMDFEKLRNLLMEIQGKFLMTINKSDYIRECFKDFIIEERQCIYRFHSKTTSTIRTELVIKNYP